MRAYVAVLLSRSGSSDPGYREMVEETICLIYAASHQEALRKAEARGRESTVEFLNEAGQRIEWTFVRVDQVSELLYDDVTVDTDLLSRHFYPDEGRPASNL